MGNDNRGGDDWVEKKVFEVVAEFSDVKPEAVTREARLLDLTDSLGLTEIVMALEDELESSIPDEDVGSIVTVGQLVEYVKAHVPSKATRD